MIAVKLNKEPDNYPLSSLGIGEIGIVTRSGSGQSYVGQPVIGVTGEVCFPHNSTWATKASDGWRYRPLQPGESVTFTQD